MERPTGGVRPEGTCTKSGIAIAAACLLIVLLASFSLPPASSAAVSASDPAQQRDLSNWLPREDGIISLTDSWTLYWNHLLEPGNFAAETLQDEALSVIVPAQWKAYTRGGQPLPNEGFATYRTTFALSAEAAAHPLGLYVNNVASAYRLWINGVPMEGNGTVGTDAGSMSARSYPKTVFFAPKAGVNEIVIQVSNFAQRTGGIWESLDLGDAEQIASLHRNRVMIWAFLAGTLLLMAVFSGFLYLFRKKEPAPLWFGLICVAICIRSSLLGESFAYVLLPELNWEWGVKLEYISEIVTILGIAAFVNTQYPHEAFRSFSRIFAAALAAFGAFVLLSPAKVYTQYMVPYVLLLLLPVFLYVMYVYIRAALNRRTGSRMNMTGFFVFFASVVHEVLYYVGFVSFGGLVPFGLLFFLLTQLLNVSLSFTRAVTRSELLSAELSQVIEAQEKTIRDRTSSLQELNERLEEGNRELSRIEHVRSTLLAEAHHDLSTPVTSIKGFSKAVMTGVIAQEDAPRYAKRIYERTLLLEQLIDSLAELSQLKTGELRFQYAEVPLLPYLRQLSHRYEAEAGERQISLFWEEPHLSLPPGQELRVSIDPFRFERVFANLISNALKYTAAEGVIRVWIAYHHAEHTDRGHVVIHVTDSGIGIPASELPHIFKRRYRVPDIRQAQTGSGLGLSICTEIVTRHGGEIGVTSLVGEGSDFFITLPVLIRAGEADSAGNA